MTSPREHERYRRQLEKQLRADVELLYAGYCAKLRAYETLHGLDGEVVLDLLPPADFTLALPPAAVPPAPPAPRSRAYALYYAISDAMGKLPELFDRHDVEAALGFTPRRASLYRVLGEMAIEGSIAVVSHGEGTRTNRYRKLAAAHSQATGGTD